MFITVEELYEMKDKYSREILELEMKKSVVDDLIAVAEAKEPCKSEAYEEENAEGYEEVSVDETVAVQNY